jgi:polyhydroxybutyrate depolymerase
MELYMKKWFIRLPLIVLGLLITLILLVAAAFWLANDTNGTLVSSGEERSYLLYVPENYDPSAPTPLVISIHGFAEWPAHQMEISHWNSLADQYGFIVVYPSGTRFPLRWRTQGTPGSKIDPMLDVTFISDLIDQLAAEYNIDPTRIYANGLSNGGGMSFVLSCKLLAHCRHSIGLRCVPFAQDECSPSRPVPVIVFTAQDQLFRFRADLKFF